MPALLASIALPHRRSNTRQTSIDATRLQALVEAAGARLIGLYWSVTPDQVIVIAETSSEQSAAAIKLAMSRLPAASFQATAVFSTDEYLHILASAGETNGKTGSDRGTEESP
jgi:uncharacterized protein with GYD domain